MHNRLEVKSVTIQINDLFEFVGQRVPAQRPDNAVTEGMARREFEFLHQSLQKTKLAQMSRGKLAVQREGERIACEWRRETGRKPPV